MVNTIPIGQSRLGFGCAHLPGNLSRREAVALVETALDCGIRHIDVARMYGDGRAEGLVGEVARRRRDEMILVTKAGISPAPGSLPARAARKAMHMAPALVRALPEGVRAMLEPRFGQFDPMQIRASVETSLRQLNTDRLDALLLHECHAEHLTEELGRTLEHLRESGKILCWGIAASNEETSRTLAARTGVSVVQVSADYHGPSPDESHLVVHSVVSRRLPELMQRLANDAPLARKLERDCGIDPSDHGVLARLLIGFELQRRPRAVVLFSSRTPRHIRSNAELVGGGGFPMTCEEFDALVAEGAV